MRKLVLKPKRAEIVGLETNLELWPEIVLLTAGFKTAFVATQKSPIPVSHPIHIAKGIIKDNLSIGWSSIATIIRSTSARAFFSIDIPSEASQMLTRMLPELPQVILAHGSLRAENLLKSHQYLTAPNPNRKLLVWGQHDVELIHEVVGSHVQCAVVGSLRNAGYHLMRRASKVRPTKNNELLLVSQYSPKAELNYSFNETRARVLHMMKQHLSRYCRVHGIPLLIALRPKVSGEVAPGQWEEERRHYREIFWGVDVTFTDPNEKYSTYAASDASNVTIGVPSGSLTESCGRGNKVLMFGAAQAPQSMIAFPHKGLWLVEEPSYEEFSDVLSALRNLTDLQFGEYTSLFIGRMIANAKDSSTVEQIRGHLNNLVLC